MNKILDLTINNYLTKEQYQEQLGSEFTPEVWSEIKSYRKRFVNSSGLNFDDKMAFVSMTPYITSKYIKLEKLFMKLDKKSFQYAITQDLNPVDYTVELKVKEIEQIIKAHGFDINESILKDIYLNKESDLTVEDEIFANSVCRAFEELSRVREEFSRETLSDVYSKFDSYSFIRQRDVKKSGSKAGLDTTSLNSAFDKTVKFIEQNNMPTIIKAVAANFYYRNAIFNEKYNDLMSFIALDLVLSGDGYKNYMSMVNFIGTALEESTELNKAFNESIKARGDVTYYLDFVLTVLLKAVEKSIAKFDEVVADLSSRTKSEKKLRAIMKRLMLKQISLKKKQAWYLVNNCEVGMNYTIDDYKTFNKTSYETSRYSMDNLVKLGYYSKTKSGKKFIYECIDANVLKGGI